MQSHATDPGTPPAGALSWEVACKCRHRCLIRSTAAGVQRREQLLRSEADHRSCRGRLPRAPFPAALPAGRIASPVPCPGPCWSPRLRCSGGLGSCTEPLWVRSCPARAGAPALVSVGLGGMAPGMRMQKKGPLRGPVRDWSGGPGIAPDRLSPGALLRPPNRNERRIRSRSCRRPTADLAPWEPPGCSRRSDGGRRHRGCASARTHRCCAGWGARRRCCTRRHRRWDP